MRNHDQRKGTRDGANGRRLGWKAAVSARAWVVLAMSLALGALEPRSARACGGLFCDVRPSSSLPLPVAQNGANVVFAIDEDPAGGATRLTAHIQILYTGDAATFSWIVPVDAAPTIDVGTDQLFTSLLGATQPRFLTTSVVDGKCLPEPRCESCEKTPMPGGGPSSGGADAGSAAPSDAVKVSFQGAVGPYDAAVIQSTDPTELESWLTRNGYVVDDRAAAIIDMYVREKKFFVAMKLMNGKDTRSIQPVVLKFIGAEPSIPLRLTAVAANPDMPVRIWVLARGRVVPKTFFEVKIDEARIDWTSGGSNYASLTKSLLGQAADEAGGRAFVTEYAGPSSIAANLLWSPTRFDLTALEAAQTPPAYVQALVDLGLAANAQVLPLLDMYIPMPDELKAMGLSDAQFYGHIASYWSQYKFPAFDLTALTAAIKAKVIASLQAAQAMLDGHPYLTRMSTFISPEEMDKDALFFESSGLGDVALVHTATFRAMCGDQTFMACNAPVRLELADGRMAWVRNGSTADTCQVQSYDLTGLQGLPAAERVWQRDVSGEGRVIMDNGPQIEAGLAANNNAFPAAQKMFPMPTRGGGDLTTTSGGGCACGVGGGTAGGGAGLGAAAAALVLARRRRARWAP